MMNINHVSLNFPLTVILALYKRFQNVVGPKCKFIMTSGVCERKQKVKLCGVGCCIEIAIYRYCMISVI